MKPTLPHTVTPYRTIGPFDQSTLPKGLLRDHNTKAGVWGLLEVLSGEVQYEVTEPGHAGTFTLSPSHPGVIVPLQKHHLKLTGDVTFRITFHRREAEQ
ncbi:MAG: DUF1971 domain-containing protein [Pseudomonadota bacterium]